MRTFAQSYSDGIASNLILTAGESNHTLAVEPNQYCDARAETYPLAPNPLKAPEISNATERPSRRTSRSRFSGA